MTKRRTPPALILCCVDYRYIEAIQAFVKRRLGVAAYDLKTDAGAAKTLLDGNAAVRTWMLHNIRLVYRATASGRSSWSITRTAPPTAVQRRSRMEPKKRPVTPSSWRWRHRC